MKKFRGRRGEVFEGKGGKPYDIKAQTGSLPLIISLLLQFIRHIGIYKGS